VRIPDFSKHLVMGMNHTILNEAKVIILSEPEVRGLSDTYPPLLWGVVLEGAIKNKDMH
jgi:hypothetical protein